MKVVANWLRRLLGEGWKFYLYGVIGIPVCWGAEWVTGRMLRETQDSAWWKPILRVVHDLTSEGLNVAIFLIVIGGVVSYSYGRGREIWDETKGPVLRKIDVFKQDVLNAIRTQKAEEAIDSLAPEEAASFIPRVTEKAYGPHITRAESFYAQMWSRLSEFYNPRKPYRSGFRRVVTIREQGNGKLDWHEVTSYQLCCDLLENCLPGEVAARASDCLPHKLRYYSKTKIAEGGLLPAIHGAKIEMRVDGELVFSARRDFQVFRGEIFSSNKNARATHDDGCLCIEFEKDIRIAKSGVRVEIEETSILEPSDNVIVFRSQSPTRRASFQITIPDGWAFKEVIFGNKSLWEQRRNPDTVLIATADSWVASGLLMSCVFEKTATPRKTGALPSPPPLARPTPL